MPDADPGARAERVAAYKRYLRECIDRRPSGLRGRLAAALGKHKSFVSQITNPAYAVPIPAGDLPVIVDACHLAPGERSRFLELYRAAHPDRRPRSARGQVEPHELRIALPRFSSEGLVKEVEGAILESAQRIIRLAQRLENEAHGGAGLP